MKNTFALLIIVSVVLAGIGGAALAQDDIGYEEYAVVLDGEIAGIVVEPSGEGPFPTVLMLHGFASYKDEVGEMYKRLAAQLGAAGIASLRIDFRGWGESGGGMENSTVDGMVEDAATAYAYLAEQAFVDTAHLGVLGFSLGGRIAIVTAAQNPGWYQSMGLWSTGGNILATFLGEDTYNTAVADGVVTVDLGWREVTLGVGFFDSLEIYDMEAEYPNYDGAVLIVAGSTDTGPAHYLNWYLNNTQGELRAGYLIEGGDHIYAVLTDDQTMANAVIDTTADWFAMTLD
ncbi:MAG: alpha/beta hydrolase [Anaerolineae bacterium]|nr:alpha/beta hydrolase [Anaerolineae bacterium]